MHEGSDLDVLVVKRTDLPFVERPRGLYALLAPGLAIDAVVYTPEEFARLSADPRGRGCLRPRGRRRAVSEDQNQTEARRWLAQAQDDLAFARLGLREGFFAQACFLSQQAGEKALKALRYLRGDRRVLGHSLVALVDCSPTRSTSRT